MEGRESPLVAVTGLRGAAGALPIAAALGIAAAGSMGAGGPAGVVLCDRVTPARRPTLLASAPARDLEGRARGALRAAARGALCWVSLAEGDWRQGVELARGLGASLVVVYLPPREWRELVTETGPGLAAAVVRGDAQQRRALTALVAIELLRRGTPTGVVTTTPGRVASRRALAGVEPGGALGARACRLAARLLGARGIEAGQALPLVLGLAMLAAVAALAIAWLGVAATGSERLQRAADLAAVSAARSMRDDHHRLFLPTRTPRGAPVAAHLSDPEYRARARIAAGRAARANGMAGADLAVSFPQDGFAPTRVRVRLVAAIATESGRAAGGPVAVTATAEARPQPASLAQDAAQLRAEGGGYAGPLVERQGKRMRPDVAAAFDRLHAAARRAGHEVVIASAFRSDAEQAALFAANPDPRWVAPPGTSLHRCATELDLGPAAAYGWLAANARRFGFVKRYSWEPWHFGFDAGPAPCSAAGNRARRGGGDGAASGSGLPEFVPQRFREPLARAAARWNVSAGLLAAQLMAESGFNPFAVSPAGARGIAQFMPGTAAAYGLRDPFDPQAAIRAQAQLMSDLLEQFGSPALALAAYNAGPAPVAACDCVPAYPETQAYVARVLGLLGGSGEIAPPDLEVRLVG